MGILEKRKARLREIVVLAAVTMFVIAPFVSIMHRTSEPVTIVRQEEPIEGTTGYTVYGEAHAPQTTVVVYNGTVNDPSADWRISVERYCQSYDESRGVRLELDGVTTPPGGYAGDSRIHFIGKPTLPLFNYSGACFSVAIKVVQGSANVSLRVGYVSWPDLDDSEAGWNSTYLEENQSAKLLLRPSLSGAFNLSSGWIVRTTMIVEIVSLEKSLVLIGAVVISVESNENLFPATLDFQAPDGESLFLNPYMRDLRGGYERFDEDWGGYPAVELTRTGNASDSSIFGQRITNETLFLAEGTYEGIAGWFYGHGYNTPDSVFNISFTVESNVSLLIFIRIPAIRLYIDICPSFAYSRVTVLGWGYDYHQIDYPLQDAECLYMPNIEDFLVYVRPLIYESHRFVDYAHFSYKQATAEIFVQTNGTSCVRVTTIFSQFPIFGIILDWGQILGIMGAALLFVLLIHGAAKRGFAGVRTGRILGMDLLPVSLYYISAFLPWVSYSFVTDAVSPTRINGEVMVPLFTTLWWSPQSQLTPAPSSYLLPSIPIFVFLYWIPVIYLSYLIATRKDYIGHILSDWELTDPIISLAIFGGPFFIGCLYAGCCIIGLCLPSVGLIAALLTLPSWGVVLWLRRKHDVSHAINVNRQ